MITPNDDGLSEIEFLEADNDYLANLLGRCARSIRNLLECDELATDELMSVTLADIREAEAALTLAEEYLGGNL